MAFSDVQRQVALLAYPLFSNVEIAEHIGCSAAWLEKLAKSAGLKKGPYFFGPGQSGFPLDLTGYRFGRLTVISCRPHKEKNNTIWVCQCECGKSNNVRSSVLRKGLTTECGNCAKRVTERRRKRGEIGSWVWSKIKAHAIERGIPILVDCDHIVQLFKDQSGKCALSGLSIEFPAIVRDTRSGTASLDRINSDLPYQSGNLQWLHKDINMMKNKHDSDYFVTLCMAVANHCSKKKSIKCKGL